MKKQMKVILVMISLLFSTVFAQLKAELNSADKLIPIESLNDLSPIEVENFEYEFHKKHNLKALPLGFSKSDLNDIKSGKRSGQDYRSPVN